MGRGPGVLPAIGFQVSAVSDGGNPADQQAVQILRNGTDVSSAGDGSTTLGDFNQLTNLPPLVSTDGTLVLVAGTDTENPIIGEADPAGKGDFQKRLKLTALTANSPLDTKLGYMTSNLVGNNNGNFTVTIEDDGAGNPLMAYKIEFEDGFTASNSPGAYYDNGGTQVIGTTDILQTDDYETIGFGIWNGQAEPDWLYAQRHQAQGPNPIFFTKANVNVTNQQPRFVAAAPIALAVSQDVMMRSNYALNNNENNINYDLGTSYPNLAIGDAFTSQAPATDAAQVSYEDQTIGAGTGDGILRTGVLYDFGFGGATEAEMVTPTYQWALDNVTGTQSFGWTTTRLFDDYSYNMNIEASGANNYAVNSSVPAAIGMALYNINGNPNVKWGLMGITYSIGAEIESAPTDTPETATFNYGSVITIGHYFVDLTKDSSTNCGELPVVEELNGSATLTVCAGQETSTLVSADFSF